jgi:signal transduction histidine kinase
VQISPLSKVGNQVRFWVFAPVIVDGNRAGWIAQARKVSGARNAERFVSEMLREEVKLNLRNADGSVWATAPGSPISAPDRRRITDAGILFDRAGVGEVVAEETPVAGAPWVMVLESPRAWILARPKPTIKLLATLCLALIIVGAGVSWWLSRRITKPLATLTDAAETVALGTYDKPLAMERRDEIGRLAASFDEMARRVRVAQRELEKRAADSDAAAAEVAKTNEQLRAAMQEVERATRAKGDFLAMMSHELRTPLNAIGGYAELIDMGIHGPVTDAQREALARLGRNKAHLLALIDHVLNFGRITAG